MTGDTRKGGKDLDEDMAWAKRELLAGRRVWCVRTRRGGLVVTFLSTLDAPDRWLSLDGEPLEEFTLTPITMYDPETGEATTEPRFGYPGPWPVQRTLGVEGGH